MNKDEFILVLQSALLWFDGGEPEKYGIPKTYGDMGAKMAQYLKNFEIVQESKK